MVEFSFKNISSKELGVYAIDIDRTLLPTLRRRDYLIPGRHGTLDYGENTYENRIIQIEIGVVKECDSVEDFREHIRKIAFWLSGSGYLIFADEPDRMYNAKVYDSVGLDRFGSVGFEVPDLEARRFTVAFECHPFAESTNYRQEKKVVDGLGEDPLELDVKGTQDTCSIIKIKNIGNNVIRGIDILRRADVK